MLGLLDFHRRGRRLARGRVVHILGTLLACLLMAMLATSIVALSRITTSVQSLINDAAVGIEASVAMRGAVREMQLHILRLSTMPRGKLSAETLHSFEAAMPRLIAEYRSGVMVPEDEDNARLVEMRTAEYVALLHKLDASGEQGARELTEADNTARSLVDAVEEAYQFNRRRLHTNAEEAKLAASEAIKSVKMLWIGFGLFAVVGFAVYSAARRLVVPEDDHT